MSACWCPAAIRRNLRAPLRRSTPPQRTTDRPTTPTSPWLTTEQAASYLSVSGGTLRNWRSSGAGPRYRTVGRIVRYHRDDLDAFLMEGAA